MNMLKKLLLTSFCATVFRGWAACAADLSPPQQPLPPLPPPFTWTGIYVGGQIGYAWAPDDFNFVGFDPVSRLLVNGIIRNNPKGVIGGAHLGSQVQFDQFNQFKWLVLGIEGSVDGTSLNSTTAVATIPNVFKGSQFSASLSDDVQGSIRGKIGIALDRVLIYGTGGVAFGGFNTEFDLTAPTFFAAANTSSTRVGWTAGGGIQYAAANNWWYFIEYRFTDFGTLQSSLLANELPPGAFFNGNRRLQENQVQAGFSYRFNLLPPAQPVIAKY